MPPPVNFPDDRMLHWEHKPLPQAAVCRIILRRMASGINVIMEQAQRG